MNREDAAAFFSHILASASITNTLEVAGELHNLHGDRCGGGYISKASPEVAESSWLRSPFSPREFEV